MDPKHLFQGRPGILPQRTLHPRRLRRARRIDLVHRHRHQWQRQRCSQNRRAPLNRKRRRNRPLMQDRFRGALCLRDRRIRSKWILSTRSVHLVEHRRKKGWLGTLTRMGCLLPIEAWMGFLLMDIECSSQALVVYEMRWKILPFRSLGMYK